MVCNFLTAFAAARLAQDTNVDDSTGYMTVKSGGASGGSTETTVITQGTGVQLLTQYYPAKQLLQPDNVFDNDDITAMNDFVCISTAGLAQLWQATTENIAATILLQSDDTNVLQALEIDASGSFFNATHVAFAQTNPDGTGVPMALVLEFGAASACDTVGRRRRRRMQQQQQSKRRTATIRSENPGQLIMMDQELDDDESSRQQYSPFEEFFTLATPQGRGSFTPTTTQTPPPKSRPRILVELEPQQDICQVLGPEACGTQQQVIPGIIVPLVTE